MKKKTFNFAMALMFGASIFFCLSCGNSTSKKNNLEIVHQKKFGLSHITMCLVTDTSDAVLIEIGKNIAADNNSAYVFFYTDRSKIKDITLSNDLIDAIPGDGFFAKYSTADGFVKNVKTFVAEPPKGPVTITLIEKKTRNSIYNWYTYYVENYTDTKETNDKMIAIAQKAPYSNDGLTEIFFFNNKENAPKLASDGGWGGNESQNSWNQKYGKYCVGYYSVGGGYSGEFTQGWK